MTTDFTSDGGISVPHDVPVSPKRALDLYPEYMVSSIPKTNAVVCHTIIYISVYAALTGQAPPYLEFNRALLDARLPRLAVEAFITRYGKKLVTKGRYLANLPHYSMLQTHNFPTWQFPENVSEVPSHENPV